MAANSRIQWPVGLAGADVLTSLNEGTHAQKTLNAAGEEYGILLNFDGSELDYIEIALGAGTAATNVYFEIMTLNTTQDSAAVTSMWGSTGSAVVTNGSADCGSVGGSAAWVRGTFGATGPSPSGYHWVVVRPVGGAFNILLQASGDWITQAARSEARHDGLEKLKTSGPVYGVITVGQTPMRIKRKDGTFCDFCSYTQPFFSSVAETLNSRSTSTTAARGMKFVAPYDMELTGVSIGITGSTASSYYTIKLVNSSDTVLATTTHASLWEASQQIVCSFGAGVTLTQGSTYRIYIQNGTEAADSISLATVTITSGDYALINLASGDIQYTYCTLSGGVPGTWTDVATEIPMMFLIGKQDLDALAGGGGETDGDKVLSNSTLVTGNVNLSNVLNTETHGTYVPVVEANVKTGVTYGAASALTGTYTGSDRWTDPGIANVRTGTSYKADSITNNRTGTCAVPTAAQVLLGTSVDATTGTVTQASVGDVRNGTTFGPSLGLTGTCHVPTAANVRFGTNVDATTGTCYVPAAGDVEFGVNVDATTGTFVVPTVAQVEDGVFFGNASEFEGTLVAGGGSGELIITY